MTEERIEKQFEEWLILKFPQQRRDRGRLTNQNYLNMKNAWLAAWRKYGREDCEDSKRND